jgi:hypothetical protein
MPIPLADALGKDRTARSLTDITWQGRPAYLLACKAIRTGADVRITVVPSMNYAIVEMTIALSTGGKRLRGVRKSDLSLLPDTTVWYPTRTEYTEYADDAITLSEIITVSQVEVNKPIPAGTFTLAGLNVPDRQLVLVSDSKTPMMWAGGKLVPYVSPVDREVTDDPPVPVGPPAGRWPSLLYAVAAALLALLAVAFLRRAVRR